MSEEDLNYERRLNSLLFDAANKTDEFVRHKIAMSKLATRCKTATSPTYSNAAASTTRC